MGCGGGWLSEILAVRGYDVTGTTISDAETAQSQSRVEALKGVSLLKRCCERCHKKVRACILMRLVFG